MFLPSFILRVFVSIFYYCHRISEMDEAESAGSTDGLPGVVPLVQNLPAVLAVKGVSSPTQSMGTNFSYFQVQTTYHACWEGCLWSCLLCPRL